jgi:hypothetical protein
MPQSDVDAAKKMQNPTVRGEDVEILSAMPPDFTCLGHLNGDILVRYPDGEEGCVELSEIREADD